MLHAGYHIHPHKDGLAEAQKKFARIFRDFENISRTKREFTNYLKENCSLCSVQHFPSNSFQLMLMCVCVCSLLTVTLTYNIIIIMVTNTTNEGVDKVIVSTGYKHTKVGA